jgi:putative peptidoglycan lipid II flippase
MSLFKNVLTVSFFTSISRVLGMVREILMSYLVGASWISDAFIIAFKFPNFFRRFFAEGAFNAAFVPEFSGRLTKNGADDAKALAQSTYSVMAWFLVLFCLIVIIFAPYLIYVLAPGFSKNPEKINTVVLFIRITFPYILFISLSALFGGVLNSVNRFAAGAAAPIILNVVMIVALLTHDFFDTNPTTAQVYAVLISGVLQYLWMYFAVKRLGYPFKLTWPKLTPDVKRILKLMVPGAIGAGITQINLFIDMMLASFLPEGSMSYLYYADRLSQLPLSIFGVAMGTALLPQLSKLIKGNQMADAQNLQLSALGLALQMTIPAATALIILSTPLIAIIFGHGNFSARDVALTGPALAAFAFGLPAFVSQKVLTAAYFARADTKTPMLIGFWCVAINIFLNLILMQFLKHTGMALATSISGWVNVIVLGVILYRRDTFSYTMQFSKKIIGVIALSFFMGGVLVYLKPLLLTANLSPSVYLKNVLLLVVLGLLTYGAGVFFMERKRHNCHI